LTNLVSIALPKYLFSVFRHAVDRASEVPRPHSRAVWVSNKLLLFCFVCAWLCDASISRELRWLVSGVKDRFSCFCSLSFFLILLCGRLL
jgi:hypothetical protein